MIPVFYFSLYLCLLQHNFVAPPIKRWILFIYVLNLGWTCIPLWLKECGDIDYMPVLSLKSALSPFFLEIATATGDNSKLKGETILNRTKLAQLALLWL